MRRDMSAKTICVLGGGIGGVVAAVKLKKRLGAKANVILIDKSAYHVFQPSFLNVLSGKRTPEEIRRRLDRLERKGVEFINAEVEEISPQENRVKAAGREIGYDYLVIALGAELDMPAVPGLENAAINLYSLDGILKIKEAVARFSGGRVVILIPAMPYKCPAAPYEAAFLLDAEFRRRGVRKHVDIAVYTFEPLPMPTAGPQVGQAIKSILDNREIDFNPQIAVESVDTRTKEVSLADGRKIEADMLIAVPPHKAPSVIEGTGLANEAGWIPVDPKTLGTKHENVFAIGDVSAIKLEGRYMPDKQLMLPKAGVMAHHEAEVVAANIAAKINAGGTQMEFDGKGSCFLDLGDGTAGYAAGDFYAVPHPSVEMKSPSRLWRLYKSAFEKYWFWRWF